MLVFKLKKLSPAKKLPQPRNYRSIIWGRGQENDDLIAPIIWTYWTGKQSDCAQACYESLLANNKGYEINLVDETNLYKYLPNFPILPSDLDVQVVSDLIRLSLLKYYGGIWIDHSVIVTSSLDWILAAAQEKKAELVCFYNEHPKTYNKDPSRPIIENGFIAAIKGSKFISHWQENFQKCILSENWVQYYVLRNDFNTLTSNFIKRNNISYFSCYIAAQETMFNSNDYRLLLINAEDEYYFYLYQIRSFIERTSFCEWILIANEPKILPKLIKIRKMHREAADICIKSNCYNELSILGKYLSR